GLLRKSSHLEKERRFGVVVENELRVGRLAVVFVAEPAPGAEHARRQGVFAEKPAGDIHLMNALVAEVAVAVVPDPMPVVMKSLSADRRHRRRAAPEIVIDVRRRRLRSVHFADAGAALVT